MSQGMLISEGVVVENLPNTTFRVQINTCRDRAELVGQTVLCHLAGKMRMNWVRLLPGDKVRLEISPLDVSKGRVIFKLK